MVRFCLFFIFYSDFSALTYEEKMHIQMKCCDLMVRNLVYKLARAKFVCDKNVFCVEHLEFIFCRHPWICQRRQRPSLL